MPEDALLREAYRVERNGIVLLPLLLLEFVRAEIVVAIAVDVFERQDIEIA